MFDSSTNLSKTAPKEFERTIVPPVLNPETTAVNSSVQNNIKDDILNLTGNRVAFVEEDLLYRQFVKTLKEFLEEQDATNAKSDIDDKLTTISSNVEGLSLDKDSISKGIEEVVSKTETVKTSTEETSGKFKLSLNDGFVKQLVDNILGILNFKTLSSSLVESTITTIKSIIDGNAADFKKSLDDELNKGLEISKFAKLSSEKDDDLMEDNDDKKDKSKEGEQQTDGQDVNSKAVEDLKEITENIEKADASEATDTNTQTEISVTVQNGEEKKEGEKGEQKPPSEDKEKKDNKKDAKAEKDLKDLEPQNKKVEEQRKKKMLEIDHQLNEINNTYLRKIIEAQDIVEGYDARAANTSKQGKKNKSGKGEGLDLGGGGSFSWGRLGIGLVVGALVALWVLFRGYSRHVRVQKYIEEHKRDKDSKGVAGEMDSELQVGDKMTVPLATDEEKVEHDLDEANPEVDQSIKDVGAANEEYDKKYGSEEQPVEQQFSYEEQEPQIERVENTHIIENTETIQEHVPVPLDENEVRKIFDESEEATEDSLLGSMDESLRASSSKINQDISNSQKGAKQRSSTITSMLDEQQDRLRELSKQQEESADNVSEEQQILKNTKEASEDAAEESSDFNEEKERDREEKLSQIKENQEKAEQEAANSTREMEENKEQSEEEAQKQQEENKKNAEELNDKNQDMAENTVPKSEFDKANEAAAEVSESMETSTEELNNIENNTLNTETENALKETEGLDDKSNELLEKTDELEENVDELEKDAEGDSEIDAAAADAMKEKKILQTEYDNFANLEIDKLFNEYLQSDLNQTKNENLILMNREQLNQFYTLIHQTKNFLADILLQKCKDLDDQQTIGKVEEIKGHGSNNRTTFF